MRPAFWLAVAMALGITLAGWLRPHPALACTVLVLITILAAVARRAVFLCLLLAAATFGALRLSYAQTAGRGDLAAWDGQKAIVVGTVTSEPELRPPAGVAFVVRVERVGERPAYGRLYVTQRTGRAPGFGERVELSGRLKAPAGPRTPGGYDQAAHLARKGVYMTMDATSVSSRGPGRLSPLHRAAVAARLRIEQVLKATLPQREAALMAGLLVGSRSEIPDDIKEAFKSSGLFHLLAVSGAHIAMILLPLLWLLRQAGLHRRAAAGVLLPLVIFFIFLTGASPSVLRAGLMAVLVLLGDVLRKERNTLNTLGAACLLLLIGDPRLLFELGFQFSAAATLGILLFARRLESWLEPRCQALFGERPGHWVAAGLSVTFAAQICVEPLSLYHFGAFSAIAPLANLLVALFLAPVLQAGATAALLGLVWLPLAQWLNYLVAWGVWLLVFVVKTTAAIPGAYLQVGRLPLAAVLAWYAAGALAAAPWLRGWLVAAASVGIRRAKATDRTRAGFGAAACALALILSAFSWRAVQAGSPQALTVTFLDVGQGDAIFIRAPGGKTMLIDAGVATPPDPARGRAGYDAGESVVVPFLQRQGIKRLDYLVLTHADTDHAGGAAAVLRAIPVGTLLLNGGSAQEQGFLAALQAARERGVPDYWPAEGDQVRLGPVTLDVLNPPRVPFQSTRSDDNANCIAFRLRYGQVVMLLACDMEAVSEERLVASGAELGADLLKVAHHGSRHSSTPAFLAAVRPQVAIHSAGQGNTYGHPHAETLQRFEAVGAQNWRTDQHGSITVRTDGVKLSVSGTRGSPDDQPYQPLGIFGRRIIFSW